jgi:carboxyl-terminal processing protease
MSDQNPNNSNFSIRQPIIIAISIVIGILIGSYFFSSNSTSSIIGGEYKKINELLHLIENEYVDSTDVNELIDYSITKILEKLDPHTTYIPPKDLQVAHAQLEGDFEGIGIEFNLMKDTIYVVNTITGGPSEKAGLLAGDKIIKVDTEIVAGRKFSNADVFKRLRGKKNTVALLTIKRRGSKNLLTFKVIRDKIPTYSIDAAYMIDGQTGYIKISRFGEKTYEEFHTALQDLISQGMKRLMIDLKDNTGGYLDKATSIADELLSGNKLIVYTDGKGTKYDNQINAHETGLFEKGDVIVLVNEGSASASEILSGAIQDNDRGLIVGRRTFGKGLVQAPLNLSDGSEIRLTISRYYTPSGRSIQKPYDKNNLEEYEDDYLQRYKHGEFFHEDSIPHNDSLKYKTSKGRTVYGGGGITPDVFVARDTSQYTRYLSELFNQNIIREYTLNYFLTNKEALNKQSFETYFKSFVVSDKMLNDINTMATKAGIKFKEKEFKQSKNLIAIYTKAYIARNVWGNKGFYPIYNLTDEIYLKAQSLWPMASKINQE